MKSETNTIISKSVLRKDMLAKRDALSVDERRKKSREITERLEHFDKVKNAKVLYLYSAIGSEVTITDLIKIFPDKQIAFPRVCGTEMDFYLVQRMDDLSPGAFHVLEPKAHCPKIAFESAVCIVPGVCFDKFGARMGYGKGYYDKYFAKHPNVYKIGVAYEEQILDLMIVDEHDICMDAIITETTGIM